MVTQFSGIGDICGYGKRVLPLVIMLLVISGCGSTSELREEWANKVESGEYGWIDFNSGEVKNLDSYSSDHIDYINGNLYPEFSQRCHEQLRNYSSEVEVEIHFLLSEQGHPSQFIIVSGQASACAPNIIDALREITFQPGRRDGQPVTSVGVYRQRLSPRGGYGN